MSSLKCRVFMNCPFKKSEQIPRSITLIPLIAKMPFSIFIFRSRKLSDAVFRFEENESSNFTAQKTPFCFDSAIKTFDSKL